VAELVDRTTVDQEQCGGCPSIRGIRIRVSNVLNLLANGFSPEQILEEMPDLELEGIRASWRAAGQTTLLHLFDLRLQDSTGALMTGDSDRRTLRS
jgi:uncharacterized protein (DUF433 family)